MSKCMSRYDKVGRVFLFIWIFSLFLVFNFVTFKKKIPAEITMLHCHALKNTYHFDLDIHKGDKVIYFYF